MLKNLLALCLVHDICRYLETVTNDFTSSKSELIRMASPEYQIQLFQHCFEYLALAKKSEFDKNSFVAKIKSAQNKFEE